MNLSRAYKSTEKPSRLPKYQLALAASNPRNGTRLTQIVNTVQALQKQLNEARSNGRTIGFVPTMGALHEGHLSLVHQAGSTCDVVVCSIFVNPTQFNDPSDLEKYPRQLEQDVALLSSNGCTLAFAPDASEMYSSEEKVASVDYGVLTHSLEGAFRPGHFDGVVAIVRKLFQAVQPDCAFFGKKDFQQLAIIRELGRREFPDLNIVGCPIVREESGLALSSRNVLLSDEAKEQALALSRTLFAAAERARHEPPQAVRNWAWEQLVSAQGVDPEYLELVSRATLAPVQQWLEEDPAILLTAATVGGVRLIDNCAVLTSTERRRIGEHSHQQPVEIG
jgi:pantoate--beta-alanine ligase